jgi:ATP-binding cassette, subfamily B, bacterial
VKSVNVEILSRVDRPFHLLSVTIGVFIKKQRKIIKTNIKLAYLDNINNSTDTLLFKFMTCMIYIVGGILLTQNSITISRLYALLSYSAYVTTPIAAVINLKYNYAGVIPSAKRFFEFIDNKPENECDNTNRTVILKNGKLREIFV